MGKIRFDFKIDVVDRCALDSVALLLLLLSFDSPVFSFLMLAVKLFDFCQKEMQLLMDIVVLYALKMTFYRHCLIPR